MTWSRLFFIWNPSLCPWKHWNALVQPQLQFMIGLNYPNNAPSVSICYLILWLHPTLIDRIQHTLTQCIWFVLVMVNKLYITSCGVYMQVVHKTSHDQVTVIGAAVTLHEALDAAEQLKKGTARNQTRKEPVNSQMCLQIHAAWNQLASSPSSPQTPTAKRHR